MNDLLSGKVALVTGAGRGFGWGIARGLAQAGARVCITDVNDDELQASAADIEQDGGEVLPLLVDVRDYAAMEHAVAQCVARWGRIDAVVSNAAIMPLIAFDDMSVDLWQRMIDVNVNGVFNTVKAAWPHMKQQGGGHCIAIASGASLRGFVNEVAYVATKHALEGMTKALAMEAEPYNIAINTMGPGKIIKPTTITRAEEQQLPAEQRAQWADPVELAKAFVWLIAQPPQRYTGLRFDAGPLADTVAAEGYDFAFTPEKVTLYTPDLRERIVQRERWTTITTAGTT